MKKFLLKIIVFFILPLGVFSIVFELSLRSIPNNYSYKNEYLTKIGSKIEILILGSSHSFRGINPSYFDKRAFNASMVTQSWNYDYAIFEKFKNDLSELKLVILPVSYFSFYGNLIKGTESWRVKNYKLYYDIHLDDSRYKFELNTGKMINNFRRFVSYYGKNSSSITCDSLGYGRREYREIDTTYFQETGKKAALRHSRDINSTKMKGLFSDNISTLTDFINECNKRDIKILFFTPPALNFYSDYLDKDQLELSVKQITQMVESSDNCGYINLLQNDEFTLEDFYDADHLNANGAKKLTQILNNQVELMLE